MIVCTFLECRHLLGYVFNDSFNLVFSEIYSFKPFCKTIEYEPSTLSLLTLQLQALVSLSITEKLCLRDNMTARFFPILSACMLGWLLNCWFSSFGNKRLGKNCSRSFGRGYEAAESGWNITQTERRLKECYV